VSILRLGHLGICVSDLERSIPFYRDLLGFRLVSQVKVQGKEADKLLRLEGVDQRTVFMERDGLRVALFAYNAPKPEGDGKPRRMNQLGMAALMLRVDDLDATLEPFRKAGVHILEDTYSAHPSFRSKLVFLCDPDGTLIELIEMPGDLYAPIGTPL
jgi:lactoylglutathione lyase